MEARGDLIRCRSCGNGATMDEYYAFHPLDDSCVIPESPAAWARQERREIIRVIREDPAYLLTERVRIGKLPNDHYIKEKKTSEIVGEGLLTLDHEGLHYRGDGSTEHDFDLDYHQLYTVITEWDSSYFNLYIDGEYTDVFPIDRPSSLKFSMAIEEMHRLHVNFYKNFPWNADLYEDLPEAPAAPAP